MYLLIDESKNTVSMRYDERYMIFEDTDDGKALAVAEAKSRGFTCMGMEHGPLEKGMSFNYACGDIDIKILHTDVTKSIK